MKTLQPTSSFCFLLFITLLFSGCASTTMLTTAPLGARVYIKGEVQGTTPYKYSDTKPALSSTHITFKKQGFMDMDVILKRNERPAWGAIIGGVMVYIPLIWFAEYKDNHFYELERATQGIDEKKYINTDTLIKSEIDKSVAKEIPAKSISEITDTSLYTNQETPGRDLTKRKISQFGMGAGMCTWGGFFGMDFTHIGPMKNGVNIGWNSSLFRTPEVPADYDRFFPPMDYLNIFSINYARAFPSAKDNQRFRLEVGPSCVIYSKATIVNNPRYDPNYVGDDSFWSFNWAGTGTKHKYNKERSSATTVGASMAARMEFLLSPSFDLEISLFANINSVKSILGLGFFINFGDVRD